MWYAVIAAANAVGEMHDRKMLALMKPEERDTELRLREIKAKNNLADATRQEVRHTHKHYHYGL